MNPTRFSPALLNRLDVHRAQLKEHHGEHENRKEVMS
jgi:hypothetical protein